MKSIDIKGTARVAGGKKAAKELRKQDLVPCNIYGEKRDANNKPVAESIAISNDELRHLIYTPHIYSVNLDIDGTVRKAVMREIQFHPVKDNVLHVDFYEINETKPIVMEVPIKLNGLAEGVKAGGKLAASVRKLKVRAPYTQIPEQLDIDVTNLGLGKVIKVAELSYEGLEIVTSPSVVVCQVKMTRAAASAAAAAKK
ncbi:MAG: 50S ribosomal protein L25/general stress protein Ctc [Bacteroidales bacterium]|nr:50S ribosomal protein L25/general stress protein Ctc [Candidatus Physcousia equi]